jgi:hypothetical protein
MIVFIVFSLFCALQYIVSLVSCIFVVWGLFGLCAGPSTVKADSILSIITNNSTNGSFERGSFLCLFMVVMRNKNFRVAQNGKCERAAALRLLYIWHQ